MIKNVKITMRHSTRLCASWHKRVTLSMKEKKRNKRERKKGRKKGRREAGKRGRQKGKEGRNKRKKEGRKGGDLLIYRKNRR